MWPICIDWSKYGAKISMLTCVLIFKYIANQFWLHCDGVLVHCVIIHFSIFNNICHVSDHAVQDGIDKSFCSYCESYSESMVLYTMQSSAESLMVEKNIFIYIVDI